MNPILKALQKIWTTKNLIKISRIKKNIYLTDLFVINIISKMNLA